MNARRKAEPRNQAQSVSALHANILPAKRTGPKKIEKAAKIVRMEDDDKLDEAVLNSPGESIRHDSEARARWTFRPAVVSAQRACSVRTGSAGRSLRWNSCPRARQKSSIANCHTMVFSRFDSSGTRH
jgi:hypothetical protein